MFMIKKIIVISSLLILSPALSVVVNPNTPDGTPTTNQYSASQDPMNTNPQMPNNIVSDNSASNGMVVYQNGAASTSTSPTNPADSPSVNVQVQPGVSASVQTQPQPNAGTESTVQIPSGAVTTITVPMDSQQDQNAVAQVGTQTAPQAQMNNTQVPSSTPNAQPTQSGMNGNVQQ
jgi:hypothetical protein